MKIGEVDHSRFSEPTRCINGVAVVCLGCACSIQTSEERLEEAKASHRRERAQSGGDLA